MNKNKESPKAIDLVFHFRILISVENIPVLRLLLVYINGRDARESATVVCQYNLCIVKSWREEKSLWSIIDLNLFIYMPVAVLMELWNSTFPNITFLQIHLYMR